MTAGKKSINLTRLNACDKNKLNDTSPLIFAPAQLPKIPSASAYKTNKGIISVAANTLVTTKNLIGLVDDTSIASICSVTFIEPNSAPIPEPIFPAHISAVITGPISLIRDIATIPGSMVTAPKLTSTGRV